MTRIVVLLMLTLVLVSCESTPPASDTSQDTSQIQMSQKAALLEQIDKQYENPEAHYQLGKLYHAEGRLNKADFEYSVAIGFDPVHFRAQAALVKVLMDMKQANRAEVIADLYTSQTAVSAEKSMLLGKAFQNEGLGEYALNCYFQAVGLAPDSPEPYRLLGYHYLKEGDKVRAEEYFRRSFELNPYQSDVSGELGRMGVIVQGPQRAPSQNPNETPSQNE